MITVVYCTREHNQKHVDHIKKMAGHPKVQVIEYINNGVSLTKAYNSLLKKAEFDVVVFCHDDIEIQTKQFAKKIKKHYDNSDYGILGVAGTKFLAENGRWWEDRKTMYGRVWHTHNGKKTVSKYSEDQNKDIENVIVVDGVFFSVMKSRLKHTFDESVEGFHFYDIDFCFKNYLDGVKIGVHTDISINHMSIGETNDQWEVNRGLFAEEYKDNLPVKIDKEFKDGYEFKVLLASMAIETAIPLALKLKEDGHFVTVTSRLDKDSYMKLHANKVDFFPLDTPRGFVKGDGKFEFNTPKGPVKSEEGKLYKFKNLNYDIMHLVGSGEPIEGVLQKFFPEIPYHKIDVKLEDYVAEYKKLLA
tara:strand:+ start:7532 stop:8611 length:1080 start_codon:yes stop_codon:yes gene_type:complete